MCPCSDFGGCIKAVYKIHNRGLQANFEAACMSVPGEDTLMLHGAPPVRLVQGVWFEALQHAPRCISNQLHGMLIWCLAVDDFARDFGHTCHVDCG